MIGDVKSSPNANARCCTRSDVNFLIGVTLVSLMPPADGGGVEFQKLNMIFVVV